jgi:hypothetical protein
MKSFVLASTAKSLALNAQSRLARIAEPLIDRAMACRCANLIADSLGDVINDHGNPLRPKLQEFCEKTYHMRVHELHEVIVRCTQRILGG